MIRALSLLLFLAASQGAAQERIEAHPTMKWFEAVAGEWVVEETFRLLPNDPEERSRMNSTIRFLPSGQVVAVEEVSDNGRVLFLGFHTYNSNTKQYLNWGASSLLDLSWAHGVLDEDGAVMHYTAGGSVDPRDPHSPSIPGRGEWRLVDDNHHVFQWFATSDDGTEYLLKESRYTRR